MLKVLGISGSLRRDSYNGKLLVAAQALLDGDGEVELELFDGLADGQARVDGGEAAAERADDVLDREADLRMNRVDVPRADRKCLACLGRAQCVALLRSMGYS